MGRKTNKGVHNSEQGNEKDCAHRVSSVDWPALPNAMLHIILFFLVQDSGKDKDKDNNKSVSGLSSTL